MPGRKPGSKNKKRRITDVQLQELIAKYEAGASTTVLAAPLHVNPSTVASWLREAGVVIRPPGFRTGPDHHAWQGGLVKQGEYVHVLIYPDHPFYEMAHVKSSNANGGRYIPEHRLVMAEKLGRALKEHETVHHKDTNTLNNHPDNLQLRQGRHGKGGTFRCADCGSHNIVATELAEKN